MNTFAEQLEYLRWHLDQSTQIINYLTSAMGYTYQPDTSATQADQPVANNASVDHYRDANVKRERSPDRSHMDVRYVKRSKSTISDVGQCQGRVTTWHPAGYGFIQYYTKDGAQTAYFKKEWVVGYHMPRKNDQVEFTLGWNNVRNESVARNVLFKQ
jgi:cold shock CspA family protein